MGQAWCKEKSTKVQDSKSPLDRVFLRCAHRIYPGLKEEGSVLGGATQRVTSSEIGYASSPSREVLTRGQSIDSVDRPFHPSDWVDVNLEVPGTPRPSSTMTNLTLDTTLYPPTTLSSTNSSGSNPRDFTPIPPPRHRKKNRGRPLPPKPDEVSRSRIDRVTTKNCSKESRNSCHEPLYSSVKLHKTKSIEKQVFEHKVNGTGRVITSIVPAANRSNRDERNREKENESNSVPKNSSSVSLPNYLEMKATNDVISCEADGELKVRKITAAESLPLLIASGAIENIEENGNEKSADKIIKTDDVNNEKNGSVDEVDFSFDGTRNNDTADSIVKLDEPRITSTPVRNNFEDNYRTPTTAGGWFLHQDRASKSDESEEAATRNIEDEEISGKIEILDRTKNSRSDVFYEAEEDELEESNDNRTSVKRAVEFESEKPRTRTRTGLKRTLSNESEPFDCYEEKELPASVSTDPGLRSNSPIKLQNRSISKESLPVEMFNDSEETDSLEDDKQRAVRKNVINNEIVKKEMKKESTMNDTKTPPPSPEPKIKPEIFDNDHSTLLKVIRDEAEESNLSSMTPSLTELEAALSDMLEREDDHEKSEIQEKIEKIVCIDNNEDEKLIEQPIEPKIYVEKSIKKSGLPVSLKNILNDPIESSMRDKPVEMILNESIVGNDVTNSEKYFESTQNDFVEISLNDSSRVTTPTLEPPAKPSRLHQMGLETSPLKSGAMPTPPRRRNRSSASGHSTTVFRDNVRRSNERTVSPQDPYPNDRLI